MTTTPRIPRACAALGVANGRWRRHHAHLRRLHRHISRCGFCAAIRNTTCHAHTPLDHSSCMSGAGETGDRLSDIACAYLPCLACAAALPLRLPPLRSATCCLQPRCRTTCAAHTLRATMARLLLRARTLAQPIAFSGLRKNSPRASFARIPTHCHCHRLLPSLLRLRLPALMPSGRAQGLGSREEPPHLHWQTPFS